jgi:inosose dehydratase
LREAEYQGWLVVEAEQDPRKAHPLTYARLGHRNLTAMATEASLELRTISTTYAP